MLAAVMVWAWLWLWLAAGGRCWEQPRLPLTPAGAEVLMATLGGTRSHTAPFLALGRQLASRGHRVTLLSAFPPPPGEETPGVRQLNPEPLVRYVAELTRGWDLLGARARGEQPVPPWEAVRFGLQVRRRAAAALGAAKNRCCRGRRLWEGGDPWEDKITALIQTKATGTLICLRTPVMPRSTEKALRFTGTDFWCTRTRSVRAPLAIFYGHASYAGGAATRELVTYYSEAISRSAGTNATRCWVSGSVSVVCRHNGRRCGERATVVARSCVGAASSLSGPRSGRTGVISREATRPSAGCGLRAVLLVSASPRQPSVAGDRRVCEAALGSREVRGLLGAASRRRPDLALLDGAFPDCLLALAHRLGAPHALLNTVAAHPGAASWAAASPAPFSVTPFMGLPYTDRMALPQRLLNAAYHVALRAMQVLSTKLLLEPCVRRHLGPDVPPISWLARNTSFVLQNALSPTTLPRAYFPDVAEVGCLHCRPAKPLPQDLEEFVSGSPSGFVLVSMGSGVRAANMPAALHRLLMSAFGSLPYRVLWKHEAGPGGEGVPQLELELEGPRRAPLNGTAGSGLELELEPGLRVPGNVMLRRWLPQQDLLGHPRLRAFVGHGGLLSVLEAGFHGAPLLALPVFCDHDANAAAARRAGFARVLQLRGLTAPALAAAVRAVATDPRYREAAYRQSVLIRDQPTPPLEKAVFWTEYLLRHKGDTRHLQSAARDMAWWQLYCLDLALLVLGLPVLLWVALSRLCHLLLHSRHALAKKLKAH
ncbi:UDP-glucuronosyltransferase 2C1-like [Schistocerca nitens]|uniref:UDP-glucuronosyltransferase 2C1-like n=1 Tax=Schistocerca nitens TaxID=7011 RepID=UPI00211895AF|nr:UDP-glucuronosyltransferase 2C1-like [Schistocerca nitens]